MSRLRIAATPSPPYYAAITTTQVAEGQFDPEAHRALGAVLFDLAKRIDGFLGLEVFFDGGYSVALSYWTTLDAIEVWRKNPVHRVAKNTARSGWFGPTITRIARIEQDYGFNLPQTGEVHP